MLHIALPLLWLLQGASCVSFCEYWLLTDKSHPSPWSPTLSWMLSQARIPKCALRVVLMKMDFPKKTHLWSFSENGCLRLKEKISGLKRSSTDITSEKDFYKCLTHHKSLLVCYLYPITWRVLQAALLCGPLLSPPRLNLCKKLDLAPCLFTGFVAWLSLEQNFDCTITSVKHTWSPSLPDVADRWRVVLFGCWQPHMLMGQVLWYFVSSIFTSCFWLGLGHFSRICSGLDVVCCLLSVSGHSW